ncbi:formylglycine-generating enzyme family protein [bacterium]|nr:formylglycine-generating enzyme family protein [bacterium]
MRNFKLILAALFAAVCVSSVWAEATSRWSRTFRFDGAEIYDGEAIVLQDTDKLAYSTAMVEGKPLSLAITAEDKDTEGVFGTIFFDESGKETEGTVCWDYTSDEYKDFPLEDSYTLKETITTDTDSRILSRTVTLVPEPLGLAALLILISLLLRRKSFGLLLTVLVFGVFEARAKSYVSEVNCMQMWPFDRSVIINYTIYSDSANGFNVRFQGSFDGGETTFDPAVKGLLKGDGDNGDVFGLGKHKIIWTPGVSFYDIVTDNMAINVEIEEKESYRLHNYMILDLGNNMVSYLDDIPDSGWSDQYKTTKIVLRLVKPGKFMMGSDEREPFAEYGETKHRVTFTKPFYIGVFEVTQKQYEMITGKNPSLHNGDMRPVEDVTYNMARGSDLGSSWPESSAVDPDSFFGKLRGRFKLDFDLPTEAQWEYACRAGRLQSFNDGSTITNYYTDGHLDKLGRYYGNQSDGKGGYSEAQTKVGSYLPNSWGLYDMHGNVAELCLDWYQFDLGKSDVTDPIGAETGYGRVIRGGYYGNAAGDCRSATRLACDPEEHDGGIRIVLPL